MANGAQKNTLNDKGETKVFHWENKILAFIFCCGGAGRVGVSITTIRDYTEVDYARIQNYLDPNKKDGPIEQQLVERFHEFRKGEKKSLYYINRDDESVTGKMETVMQDMRLCQEPHIKKLYKKFMNKLWA